ncbi:reverse transcriptase domain-containing protein [Tanacetum coccineum]
METIHRRFIKRRSSGAGLILTNLGGVEFTYALRFRFKASNNEAEYEALLAGLRNAESMSKGRSDATVSEQSKGSGSTLQIIFNNTSTKKPEQASRRSKQNGLLVEEEGDTWITPIKEYLENVALLEEKGKARRLRARARQYVTLEGTLYRVVPWAMAKHALRPSVGRDKSNADGILLADDTHGRPDDICGPFPEAAGKVKFLIVAIDYFTKWIEAKPVAAITGKQVMKFVWDNIVCRFGLPRKIISDNGKQFRDDPFKTWCVKLNITQHFASVKHPQSNDLVEWANKSLGKGIKARLGKENKEWVEELPYVLWAHMTMIKSCNENAPFSLTYDTEEKRELAAIAEEKYKRKMEGYYNSKVRSTILRPRDLAYRSNEANMKEDTGKLGPKWEGPYEIVEALRYGAYKLRDQEG